jgi:hypothetical protein
VKQESPGPVLDKDARHELKLKATMAKLATSTVDLHGVALCSAEVLEWDQGLLTVAFSLSILDWLRHAKIHMAIKYQPIVRLRLQIGDKSVPLVVVGCISPCFFFSFWNNKM